MKILILCPSLNPHGGVRVIVEWANHLAKRKHDVTLFVQMGGNQSWITINERVKVQFGGMWRANQYEAIIATTPPLALDLDTRNTTGKKFYLLQMAEHLFQPGSGYADQAKRSYNVKMPIIGISQWVETVLKREFNRQGATYYIGNGVSKHFKPSGKPKPKQLTVVVADWEGYNKAKDVRAIAPFVAQKLKEKYSAHIIGWSSQPLATMRDVPDEYYHRISTEQLVEIYQRSTIMLKASMYDARSTAPVEAMACGVPTARAIHQGDDDLIHGYNCLRSGYDVDALFYNACRLIEDKKLRKKLIQNGFEHQMQFLNWDFWMGIVEDIIQNG